MINSNLTNKEKASALRQVAGLFGPAGQKTILVENFRKHVYEMSTILEKCGQSGKVLDVGGGMGVNLLSLRKLYQSLELHLIDRFEEYTGENRMGSSVDGLKLMRDSDISVVSQDFWQNPALPYESGFFDVVTCLDVVEHLPGHPLKLLAEIRRVLKEGGYFILGGPNSISLLKRVMLLFGRYPYSSPLELWCSDEYFSHYREYSPDEYRQLLEMSQFTEVRTVMLAEPSSRYQPREGGFFGLLVAAGIWMIYFATLIFPGLRPTVYCIARKS